MGINLDAVGDEGRESCNIELRALTEHLPQCVVDPGFLSRDEERVVSDDAVPSWVGGGLPADSNGERRGGLQVNACWW